MFFRFVLRDQNIFLLCAKSSWINLNYCFDQVRPATPAHRDHVENKESQDPMDNKDHLDLKDQEDNLVLKVHLDQEENQDNRVSQGLKGLKDKEVNGVKADLPDHLAPADSLVCISKISRIQLYKNPM